jgi:hypothetical protein
MANRARLTIVIVSLALSLAACASSSQMPPAAEQVHPDWLMGTWEGNAVQVAASKDAAQELPVTLTFSQGGAWKAMTGATGTSWFANNRVMLEGTSPRNSGRVRYTLKERKNADGSHELWGVADADFGAAAVSLKKTR